MLVLATLRYFKSLTFLLIFTCFVWICFLNNFLKQLTVFLKFSNIMFQIEAEFEQKVISYFDFPLHAMFFPLFLSQFFLPSFRFFFIPYCWNKDSIICFLFIHTISIFFQSLLEPRLLVIFMCFPIFHIVEINENYFPLCHNRFISLCCNLTSGICTLKWMIFRLELWDFGSLCQSKYYCQKNI